MLEPKSNYVKRKIKGLRFTGKNRAYVRKLMGLEILASSETILSATLMGGLEMDVHYKKDFIEILKEMSPKKYLEVMKDEEEEQERLIILKREELKNALEEDRLMWKKFGGRLE